MSARRTAGFRAGLVLVAAAVISACGGGGGAVAPGPGPTPVPTATPTPSRSSTASATVGAAPTTLTFPALVDGTTGALTLPAASSGAGATVVGTLSLDQPASITAPLQSARRSVRDTFVRSRDRAGASTAHTAVAYVTFSFSQDVAASGTVTIRVTLPGATAGQSYFLSFYDGTAWQYDIAGPSSPPGALTFTVTPNAGVLFRAGTTYGFAITTDVVTTPAPTASPTASPTPTPSPAPTASPTASPTLPPALPAAKFHSYSLSGTGPYGLLADTDGVWVTESSTGNLVKLTPTGTVTAYPLGTPGSGPLGPLSMTYAPDGTIWIALNQANAIAHVSSAGALLATYATSDAAGPRNITVGSAGVYYTQDRASTFIGRTTTAGASSHVALQSAGYDVTTGVEPDVYVAADTTIASIYQFGGDVSTSSPEPDIVKQGGSLTSICRLNNATEWLAVSNLQYPYVLRSANGGPPATYQVPVFSARGWGAARIGCFGSSVYLAISDGGTSPSAPPSTVTLLAQFSISGTLTQVWTIPVAAGQQVPAVSAMALGSDGNLWFVDDRNQTVDVWILQ